MNLLIIVLLLLAIFVMVAVFVVALSLFQPWSQCFMSGAPVPLFQIVAMYLRRTPVRLICEQRIRAFHLGVNLTCAQIESAHVRGADVKKAVDALCLAKETDRQVSWEDLVATDLSSDTSRQNRTR